VEPRLAANTETAHIEFKRLLDDRRKSSRQRPARPVHQHP